MKILKTTKPKPFELEPTRPTTPAPTARPAEPRKPFMSSDIKIKGDGLPPVPPRRGPMTGEAQMSDSQFLAMFATAEELARWREELQARRAKDPTSWIFQRCDNPACGFVMRDRPGTPEGGRCPRCNMQGRADLGHFFTLSEQQANDYLFREAVKEKAQIATDRQRVYRAANAERAQKGLDPLTFEQYRKQAEAEYQQMVEQQRQLGTIAKQAREEREARERQQAVEGSK